MRNRTTGRRSRDRSWHFVIGLTLAAVTVALFPAGAQAKDPGDRSPEQLVSALENLATQCAKHDNAEKCAIERAQFTHKFGEVGQVAIPPDPVLVCSRCTGDDTGGADGGGGGVLTSSAVLSYCQAALGNSLFASVCATLDAIGAFCLTVAPLLNYLSPGLGAAANAACTVLRQFAGG